MLREARPNYIVNYAEVEAGRDSKSALLTISARFFYEATG
jgi:hypothetical protein